MMILTFLLVIIGFEASLSIKPENLHFVANPDVKIISNVLHDIVDEFYSKEKIELNILAVNNIPKFVMDIMSNFLADSGEKFAYGIEVVDINAMDENDQFPINRSSIIFLSSIQDLKNLEHYSQTTRHQDQAINFFIFIQHLTFEGLFSVSRAGQYRNLDVSFGTIFQYAFFIINEMDIVTLSTVEYFSERRCNRPVPRILNFFHKSTRKWNPELKNYEKFLNYHGCELVMLLPVPNKSGSLLHVSGFAVIKSYSNFNVYGIIPNIFRLTAKYYNYIAGFQPGYVPENFLIDNDDENINLIEMGGIRKIPMVFFLLDSIHFIDSSIRTSIVATNLDVSVVVTPAEKYTPYEKFLLPFAIETWILLLLSYSFIALSIFAINCSSESMKKLFFGKNNRSPVWDVISIFFGIPQEIQPNASFPRFMLIMFTYFCLIFRTCYQSKFFEFMTSEPRRSPPKTIADVLEREYNVYSMEANQKLSSTTHRNERWINVTAISPHRFKTAFLTQSQNSTAKMALCVDDFFYSFLIGELGIVLDWNQLEDTVLYTTHEAFQFRSYSFYYRMYKNVIDNLIQTGIMNELLYDDYTRKWKIERLIEGPKVLTLHDLLFGFNIWLCACLVSSVSFVVEQLSRLKKKKLKKLKFEKVHPVEEEIDEYQGRITRELINAFRMKSKNDQIDLLKIKIAAEVHQTLSAGSSHHYDLENWFGQKTELENDSLSDVESYNTEVNDSS